MNETFAESTTQAPETPQPRERAVTLVSPAELQDRFRNIPAPELSFRFLIKSIPALVVDHS